MPIPKDQWPMDTIEIKSTPSHYSVARGRRPVNHFQIEPAVNFRNNNGSGFHACRPRKGVCKIAILPRAFGIARRIQRRGNICESKPVKNSLDANSRQIDPRTALRFSGQIHNAVDMPRSQLLAAASEFGKNPANQAASQSHRRRSEWWDGRRCELLPCAVVCGDQLRPWRQKILDAQGNRGRRFACGQGVESFVFERPPEGFVFARVHRQTRQARHHSGIKIAKEKWNELVANPRACAGSVLIGRIFPPGLSQIGKKLAQFLAPHFQQRTNSQPGDWIDSRQARQAGAAQQMRQDSFGLVVRRVGHGDAIQAACFGHGSEKLIAQSPRGVFHVPAVKARFAGHIGAAGFKFQMEFLRQRFHEAFVFVCFRSPQLMVEM